MGRGRPFSLLLSFLQTTFPDKHSITPLGKLNLYKFVYSMYAVQPSEMPFPLHSINFLKTQLKSHFLPFFTTSNGPSPNLTTTMCNY